MRLVIWAIAGLAALWSGYWYVAAEAKRSVLERWFEQRREAGWAAEHQAIRVGGYPYRFDTLLEGLMLADPRRGIVWQAPQLQILALSYEPNHVLVFWPERQSLATPREAVEIEAGEMQASTVFRPRANAHDLAIEAQDLLLPAPLRARLDRSGLLPERIGTLNLRLTAAFDAPLDRRVIEERRPGITDLRLDGLNAVWGRLELRATGRVVADAQGYPEGEIFVRAQNWQEMLAMAVEAGVIGGNMAQVLESGLRMLARISGNPDTIDAPLTFAGGRVALGPIGLGEAPRLRQP
ncbi:MAG: hypothetical protein CVT80_12040 [Alphaproteobacteria bacterium HGW-Alphaproteobacteria-2]|nr:MAG: hypothetical protein CVT80_12040 [Alphaproteobacteria bacterium HGW-Alphaproteobacteria-2]